MTRPSRRAVMLLGVTYLVIGITFGALAGLAASNQIRVTWRLSAYLVSAVAFATHIGHELFRLRSSPGATALHAAMAVGLGAFGLAAVANLRSLLSGSSHAGALALSLVAWPAMTAVPAFLVALVLARLQLSFGAKRTE